MTDMKRIKRSSRAFFEQRAGLDPTADDLKLIAKWIPIGWPAPDSMAVYAASALVCNNLVDHYSTKFTDRALQQIAGLLPGTNVLRNHSEGFMSDDLPVGRCYDAELVKQADGLYVRARFYWERGSAFGEDMAKRVSLGIWREMSLSWWMESFTNSTDGSDVEPGAPYYPGQQLTDGSVNIGIMDDVVEVNEFSFVSRGGQKNTSINPARGNDRDALELVSAARSHKRPASGWSRFFNNAA